MVTPTATATGRATFEDDWCPRAYLTEYYGEVQHDEQVTMRFLAEAAAFVGDVPVLLEFGCGPTVHHLLPFATRAGELHVADYLERNLDAVRGWVEGHDDAWDWTAFVDVALRNELGRPPHDWEVREREAATRERITVFHRADARRRHPLAGRPRRYPAVLCCFCPDSMTDDIDEWRRCTENVASLVSPGGWLVLTALAGASSYRVGDVEFPSPGVTIDDLAGVLRSAGFSGLGTTIMTADTIDDDDHGFDSVLLAVSRRP